MYQMSSDRRGQTRRRSSACWRSCSACMMLMQQNRLPQQNLLTRMQERQAIMTKGCQKGQLQGCWKRSSSRLIHDFCQLCCRQLGADDGHPWLIAMRLQLPICIYMGASVHAPSRSVPARSMSGSKSWAWQGVGDPSSLRAARIKQRCYENQFQHQSF